MASNKGTSTINFGTAGSRTLDTTLTVTGQTGITTAVQIGVWVRLEATADHTVTELFAELPNITVGITQDSIVAGDKFIIFGHCENAQMYGDVKVDWAWTT